MGSAIRQMKHAKLEMVAAPATHRDISRSHHILDKNLVQVMSQFGFSIPDYTMHPDAKSGNDTVENVGINLEGQYKCKECRGKFIHDPLDLHWMFIHDPNRHQEDCKAVDGPEILDELLELPPFPILHGDIQEAQPSDDSQSLPIGSTTRPLTSGLFIFGGDSQSLFGNDVFVPHGDVQLAQFHDDSHSCPRCKGSGQTIVGLCNMCPSLHDNDTVDVDGVGPKAHLGPYMLPKLSLCFATCSCPAAPVPLQLCAADYAQTKWRKRRAP